MARTSTKRPTGRRTAERRPARRPAPVSRRAPSGPARYGFAASRFGLCLAAWNREGLFGLAFAEAQGRAAALADMRRRFPIARWHPDPAGARVLVGQVFSGTATPGPRPVLHGTAFQVAVWRALLRIPWGEVVTYRQIAEQVGRPRATRAVGTAVGKNPLAVLVPCHRVVASGGGLGGYRWGLALKRALLAWEAGR